MLVVGAYRVVVVVVIVVATSICANHTHSLSCLHRASDTPLSHRTWSSVIDPSIVQRSERRNELGSRMHVLLEYMVHSQRIMYGMCMYVCPAADTNCSPPVHSNSTVLYEQKLLYDATVAGESSLYNRHESKSNQTEKQITLPLYETLLLHAGNILTPMGG